ncbi:MAG: hypothetical protein KC491_14315, partial [Dehalococcoidia bacterium]|nr:hypothetical protein [Dehalococcoidia bacterium]
MKRCKACGETKALTEFYTYPSGTVDSWCRPCKRDYEKERSRRRLDAKGRSRPARWSIPPGKKWCNKCRKVLPIAEFHKRQDWCKSCRSAYATATRTRESQDRSNANTRAWRDRNPERVQELNRAYHKERYARDRDGILALNAASYARHRKARIADAKRWAEANPDRRREIVQRWET